MQKKKRLHELEIQTFKQNLGDFDRRNKEHNDNTSKHKIEIARLAREKNSQANQIVEFLEQKKLFRDGNADIQSFLLVRYEAGRRRI